MTYLVFAVVLVLVVVRLVVVEGQKLAHYLVVTRMRRRVGRSRSVVLAMARLGWVRRGVLPFYLFWGEVLCGVAQCWKVEGW